MNVSHPLHSGIQSACTDCRGAGYIIEKKDELAIALRCRCVRKCTICRDTGWAAVERHPLARLTRCTCTELDRRILLWNTAAIPGRHARSSRMPDSFKPHRDVMEAMKLISHYLQNFDAKGENRGFIFYGGVGVGKTHLLVAVLRELVFVYGVTIRFIEFSHLLAELKGGFDKGESTAKFLDPLVKVDILAIDELGKGRNTGFEGSVVDELVSRRYNAGRTILATTNYSPGPANGRAVGDLVSGESPALVDRVGDRVFSRLMEMCDFCQLRGRDYRMEIASKARSTH